MGKLLIHILTKTVKKLIIISKKVGMLSAYKAAEYLIVSEDLI